MFDKNDSQDAGHTGSALVAVAEKPQDAAVLDVRELRKQDANTRGRNGDEAVADAMRLAGVKDHPSDGYIDDSDIAETQTGSDTGRPHHSGAEVDAKSKSPVLSKAFCESVGPKLASIKLLADEVFEESEALEAGDLEAAVIYRHAWTVQRHCAALTERIADSATPLAGRLLLLSSGTRLPVSFDPDKVIETEDAYDEAKINNLDERDIRDAIEFDTELKDMFGLASMDEELRDPLHDALHLLHDEMEDGIANVPGTVVRTLKALLKGHPRGFGRYYSGKDPWPRPSAEIQAEIDARMPDALYWLRYELGEALEEEAAIKQEAASANSHVGGSDER